MKLTSLIIQHSNPYSSSIEGNPMKAVVKLASEHSTVETVLSDETMRRVLDLVAGEIAENTKRNVADFVDAVSQIESGAAALIGSK